MTGVTLGVKRLRSEVFICLPGSRACCTPLTDAERQSPVMVRLIYSYLVASLTNTRALPEDSISLRVFLKTPAFAILPFL